MRPLLDRVLVLFPLLAILVNCCVSNIIIITAFIITSINSTARVRKEMFFKRKVVSGYGRVKKLCMTKFIMIQVASQVFICVS